MSQPAVFLDRDGTIIEHYDYLTDESEVSLLPGVGEALRLLRRRGYKLVMITNQSGVARGKLTERKLLAIHDYLGRLLAEQRAFLDKIYYCPYHPEAIVEQYRQDSELRKPAPGMLNLAMEELDVDLSRSWMVGDDDRDIEAGRAAGCRTLLLEGRGSSLVRRGGAEPDFRAKTILEAANLIVRHGAEHETPVANPQAETEPDILNEPPHAEPQNVDHSPNASQNHTEPAPQEHIAIAEDAVAVSDLSAESSESGDKTEAPSQRPNHTIREAEIARRKSQIGASSKIKSPGEELNRESPPGPTPADGAETTLREILRELKNANRQHTLGSDFSIGKLLAVIAQMLVMMSLVLAFWFGAQEDEPKTLAVQACLLLAVVFQVLTLTLVLWSRRE